MKFLLSFATLLLAVSQAVAAPVAEASPEESTRLESRATLSTFAGTNAYWLPFLTNDADVDKTFAA